MKVLLVTGHIRDADFIEHELKLAAPLIQIDVSPHADDALIQLAVSGEYDVVLIDRALPGTDYWSLIARLHERSQAPAILVLTSPGDEDPPLQALEAGADDYLVKRPRFVDHLPGLLQRALERRRSETERSGRALQVLFVGIPASAQQNASRWPSLKLHAVEALEDGSCHLPAPPAGFFPYDAVVLDDEVSGVRVLRTLKEISLRAPEVPIVLLVETGRDAVVTHGLKLGAADCVVKSGDYHQCLVPRLENAIRRRHLAGRIAGPSTGEGPAPPGAEQRAGAEEWQADRRKHEEQRAALEQSLRDLEAQRANLEEQLQKERAGLHAAQAELEKRRAETDAVREEMESRRKSLEEASHVLEAYYSGLEELSRKEKEEWEQTRQELELRYRDAEAKRAALEESIGSLELRLAEREKRHHAEQAVWEKEREEWRRSRENLLSAQASSAEEAKLLQVRLTELEALRQKDLSAWDQKRREWERQQQDLAAQAALLGKAMAAKDAKQTKSLEEHRQERADWEKMREELEHQRAARVSLTRTLHATEARLASLVEKQRTERAEWQAVGEELERQRAARLALEDALRAAETRLAALAGQHAGEHAELEVLRREVEGQRMARLALEGALRAAEERQSTEPFTRLATAAVQALADLVGPLGKFGELLTECLDETDARREQAVRVVETARRAGNLAGRLLAMRSPQEALSVNFAVAQMSEALRRLAGENVELLTILSPRLPRILTARARVEQLLTALVILMRESLPVGGTISLETALPTPESVQESGPCILLAATASGHGLLLPAKTCALESLIAECGGRMSISGDTETGVTLEAYLPAESSADCACVSGCPPPVFSD